MSGDQEPWIFRGGLTAELQVRITTPPGWARLEFLTLTYPLRVIHLGHHKGPRVRNFSLPGLSSAARRRWRPPQHCTSLTRLSDLTAAPGPCCLFPILDRVGKGGCAGGAVPHLGPGRDPPPVPLLTPHKSVVQFPHQGLLGTRAVENLTPEPCLMTPPHGAHTCSSSSQQRLIPVDASNDLFVYKAPEVPARHCYVIRPYVPADRPKLFSLILHTADDRRDGSALYAAHPNLPGDL